MIDLAFEFEVGSVSLIGLAEMSINDLPFEITSLIANYIYSFADLFSLLRANYKLHNILIERKRERHGGGK